MGEIMNTTRVIQSAQELERHQMALKWLLENGTQLTGKTRDEAAVSVRLNFASALPGAKEAQEVLSSYARLALPELVRTSIRSCENTIEMCASAIREEAATND